MKKSLNGFQMKQRKEQLVRNTRGITDTVILTNELTGEKISTTIAQMRNVQIKVDMMRNVMELSDSETKNLMIKLITDGEININDIRIENK